jgi:hypothetical protein
MSQYAREKSQIIPFDSSAREKEANELDRSGHAILALPQQAAQAARADEDRAAGVAQNLSRQRQAAEDQAKELEAEVQCYQARAFAAEKWLLRVYKEIEEMFFSQSAEGKAARQ